ncbi:MAG: alanine racemase [Thermodesulfovibrionales bacterium]|nr:alanine racemase [Thermodesulfovibrionales bacterium]
MNRGAIAEIDLSSISNNLRVVRNLSNNRPVIAVVKADAYGHGAVEVSRRLVSEGVEYLAVAFTEEAKELRGAGINAPIMVLFDPDTDDIFQYNLIPVIWDKRAAVLLSREGERRNIRVKVHIKVDTGMGRLGITGDAAKDILEIANMKGLTIDGIMSHFSEVDPSDVSFARQQICKFDSLKNELSKTGLSVNLFHIANSAAVMILPESHFDAVRPGLMLYGYSPVQKSEVRSQKSEKKTEPIPAMTVKTKILTIRRLPANTPISYGRTFVTKRDSIVGVIPVGYADGYFRAFSNNAEVIVKDMIVPVIGRVCMDITMIDLTGVEHVAEGDEVIVMGRRGNISIDASALALQAETSPYEILTSLGSRATRVYK